VGVCGKKQNKQTNKQKTQFLSYEAYKQNMSLVVIKVTCNAHQSSVSRFGHRAI